MARALLGAFFLAAGALHFLRPKPYVAIVPDALPRKRELVYLSGVAEIAGGAGVLAAPTRRAAGWWLIATLVAIFPANVNMAVNAERFRGIPEPLLWLRLPVQGLFVAWVWRVAVTGAARERPRAAPGWRRRSRGRRPSVRRRSL